MMQLHCIATFGCCMSVMKVYLTKELKLGLCSMHIGSTFSTVTLMRKLSDTVDQWGLKLGRGTSHCSILEIARQHPSYDDCLEVKTEYYQNCSVLDCVTQCSQSAAHLYDQFLQVQQIGFVTLGPCIEAVA